MSEERQSVRSGAEWESRYGYHRAVAVGDRAWVSGTTAASEGNDPPDDVGEQTKAAFTIALSALADLGFERSDVVRTRMFVTDMRDAEEVGRVHGSLFANVNPAATMVAVAELIDSRLRVEIEVEAVRASTPS